MLDDLRHQVQTLLDELLGEADKLRRALATLTSCEGESARSDRPAPASDAGGESATQTTRPAPRTSTASTPPAPAPASSAVSPTRVRTAPGATKTAVLAALTDGSAMTAGEIAAATGLARASVSTTLSKLASTGEITKAARGYQLTRESDPAHKPPQPRTSASTLATSSSPPTAEPSPAEPSPAEPTAVELTATEPEAGVSPAVEPEEAEPEVTVRPAVEPPVVEPAAEPEAAEPAAVEPPAAKSPGVEPTGTSDSARGVAVPAAGATKHAVLGALAGASAMTAGEVASATGLGRASVSTTLSQLAKAGELRKAARGYQLAGVESARRFYFLIEDDTTPRAVAANLTELEAAIARCGPGVLRHHCAEHDFSRWVAGVFDNEPLAAEIAAAEAQLSGDSPTETVEETRLALIAVLQARHATRR